MKIQLDESNNNISYGFTDAFVSDPVSITGFYFIIDEGSNTDYKSFIGSMFDLNTLKIDISNMLYKHNLKMFTTTTDKNSPPIIFKDLKDYANFINGLKDVIDKTNHGYSNRSSSYLIDEAVDYAVFDIDSINTFDTFNDLYYYCNKSSADVKFALTCYKNSTKKSFMDYIDISIKDRGLHFKLDSYSDLLFIEKEILPEIDNIYDECKDPLNNGFNFDIDITTCDMSNNQLPKLIFNSKEEARHAFAIFAEIDRKYRVFVGRVYQLPESDSRITSKILKAYGIAQIIDDKYINYLDLDEKDTYLANIKKSTSNSTNKRRTFDL